MKNPTRPAPPPDEEYEFSSIPGEELAAACWWEYFRESERVLAAVQQYTKAKKLTTPDNGPLREIVGTDTLENIANCFPDFVRHPWLTLDAYDRQFVCALIGSYVNSRSVDSWGRFLRRIFERSFARE